VRFEVQLLTGLSGSKRLGGATYSRYPAQVLLVQTSVCSATRHVRSVIGQGHTDQSMLLRFLQSFGLLVDSVGELNDTFKIVSCVRELGCINGPGVLDHRVSDKTLDLFAKGDERVFGLRVVQLLELVLILVARLELVERQRRLQAAGTLLYLGCGI